MFNCLQESHSLYPGELLLMGSSSCCPFSELVLNCSLPLCSLFEDWLDLSTASR
eukprot:c56104_g1_i1 orf=23-184(-)